MTFGILLAAGAGTRMNNKNQIKSLIKYNDQFLFTYSLNIFLKNKNIDFVYFVVNPDYISFFKNKIQKLYHKYKNKLIVVSGSKKSRQHSLIECLKVIKNKYQEEFNKSIFVTHDIARANVDNFLIDESIRVAKKYQFSTAYYPVHDAIVELNKKQYNYIQRSNKYLIQTPQSFIGKLLNFSKIDYESKDLIGMMKLKLNSKNMFLGKINNFKITISQDLKK